MKRPLFVIGCTFACATWAAFLFSVTGALLLSAACAATGLLLCLLRRDKLRTAALICLSAALATACYSIHQIRQVEPFRGVEGETLEIQGVLLEESGTGRYAAYTIAADFVSHDGLPNGRTILLYSPGGLDARPGDTIRFLGRASLPENKASSRYYQTQGISLIVNQTGVAHVVDDKPYGLRQALLSLRSSMQSNLSRRLRPDSAAVISAMVLGLKDDVPAETWTDLQRSGTVHLLAVSGLHLSILTAALLGLLHRLRVPPRLRYVLTIVVAFLFAGLVGFSASIMRAFVMTALALLARCFSRRSDSLSALGLALLLICLLRPWWVLGQGLWLSAASTLGILLLAPARLSNLERYLENRSRPAKGFLRFFLTSAVVSLCAYACSLPILLLTNGWLSLVSPIANMLVAPFITIMILGGAVCALGLLPAFLLGYLAALTDFCTWMVLGISRAMAALPFAILAFDECWLLILLAVAAVVLFLLLRFHADRRLWACAGLLLLFCYSTGSVSLSIANRDKIELITIDRCDTAILLRNGSAVLLGTPTHIQINRLTRYLDFRGTRHVSAVVAPDHPNQVDSGLLRLQERYGVDCVIAPDDAYITGLLETALPRSRIFPGGYATTVALDTARITTMPDTADILVEIGGVTILKTDGEYAIIDGYDQSAQPFRDGVILFPDSLHLQFEPMGRHLFGEVRLLLDAPPVTYLEPSEF